MGRTVAVVGGGYGGTAVAKALELEAEVVLIDPRDSFVNTAGSLRALVQPDWAGNLFFPYESVFTRATVLHDRAVAVDPGGVTTASGRRVAADYVVLATGSTYAYPAKPSADAMGEIIDRLRQTHKELAGAERVLILGAGPVGLELAGEIKAVWPVKDVTVIDPTGELLPGFRADLRDELRRQLEALDIAVRLGDGLAVRPPTEAGHLGTFTVTTTGGDDITADIWFRAHGLRTNSDYLADGRLTPLNPQGQVPVTATLQVVGYEHLYAVGDVTDVAEAKLAGFALRHAEVVASNIGAQLRGEAPTATYQPLAHPIILLPLGPRGGVGQLPSPDGPVLADATTVAQFKGADMFTARFVEQFGPTADAVAREAEGS